MARTAIVLAGVAACGGDAGGGPDLISAARCVDTLEMEFAYNYLIGNATLRADSISIDVNGESFTPPGELLSYAIDSDEANGTIPDRTTFELSWLARGDAAMRLSIYFDTDGVDWWARELRHYDAVIDNEAWIYYDRELFRCPLGQSFVGDVAFEADPGTMPASITFENLWVRAFVKDEPPGVRVPPAETALRPLCAWLYGCADPPQINNTFNNCMYEWSIRGLAFRPEVFEAANTCIAQTACNDSGAQSACYTSTRPSEEAYHTAFRTQCEQYSTTCTGTADPDCNAVAANFFYVDLPFYARSFVEELATCVEPSVPCGNLGSCLDAAGSLYGLDL